MREVTAENAADYLRETGVFPPGRAVAAREMGWGVSNVVVRVDPEGGPPVVLKQARGRLRTAAHWVSRLDRIWTERAAMELIGTVVPEGAVPRVLFSDEDNFLFAMTCAPDDSVVWKEQLLGGRTDPAVARRAGALLATVHAATRDHPGLSGRLSDTAAFDELRVDPFYRAVARADPEVAPRIEALIASLSRTADRCLVLGDFSPKNILVHAGGLTLVDFETAHAGDPAFDLGFFLSHLWLKGFRATASAPDFHRLRLEFLGAYWSHADPARAAWPSPVDPPPLVTLHAAACALARVDGKSPVDYLDDAARRVVRSECVRVLLESPPG